MAVVKISELPSIQTVANNDLLPIVDVSETETKKITKSSLLTDIPAGQIDMSNVTETTQINDADYLLISQSGTTKKIKKENTQFASGDEVAVATSEPSDPEGDLKVWINPSEVVTPSSILVTEAYSTAHDKSYSCEYINDLAISGGGWTYSTTETETGRKWIDNKDIYRRIVTKDGEHNSRSLLLPLGIKIDTLVSANIMWNTSSTGGLSILNGCPIPISRGDTQSALQLAIPSDYNLPIYNIKIIIEYTKSS